MLKKIWIAVLLILFIIVLRQFDLRALWDGITHIPLWLISFLLLLQIISQILVNLQWVRIAKLCDIKITFWEMFYANSHGAIVDSVTPGVKFGGEVTRIVEIKKSANCQTENAITIVALQKLFSISTFIFLCLLTVGLINTGYIYYFIPLLLIFTGLFFLPKRDGNPPTNKFKLFFHNFLTQIFYIRSQKSSCAGLFALSFFIWLLYPLKLYILIFHLYPNINIFYIGTTTFMAYMVAMIPIFPGGLGGFEATMTGMLATADITSTDALMFSLVFRFFTFWLVMIFSLGFVVICNFQK